MTNTQQTEMRTALLEYIRNRGGVTNVELCRDIPGFTGDDTAAHPNNVIFWNGVNLEVYNVLIDLIAEGLIEAVQASLLTYTIDGAVLSLPIAGRLDKVYKKPHWLPLVFNAVRSKQ